MSAIKTMFVALGKGKVWSPFQGLRGPKNYKLFTKKNSVLTVEEKWRAIAKKNYNVNHYKYT